MKRETELERLYVIFVFYGKILFSRGGADANSIIF